MKIYVPSKISMMKTNKRTYPMLKNLNLLDILHTKLQMETYFLTYSK